MANKQSKFWFLAAIAAPIANFASCGWLTASLAALTILPLAVLPKSWEGMPKWLAIAEAVWLGAVAGLLLQNSAAYWPSDNALAVPLTLLALAAFTGSGSAPRVGAVLALCMALLAVPLAVSGTARAEPKWLKPEIAPWPMALTAALLLPNLPASGEKRKPLLGIGALVLALSTLIQGTISHGVAATIPDAFYQTSRALGYLEPVAAAAMTLGWYTTAGYLLESSVILTKAAGVKREYATVLHTGTAAVVLLFSWQPQCTKIAVLSAFFWVLIPFFMFLKKVKNSA